MRTQPLPPLSDEVRDAFGDGEGGGVGVGADAVGHDGGVDDAKAVQAVYAPVLVDHRHLVRCGAHLAGAGYVMAGGDGPSHPVVEAVVRIEVCIKWLDPLHQDVAVFWVLS